jgi:hypothetical protein
MNRSVTYSGVHHCIDTRNNPSSPPLPTGGQALEKGGKFPSLPVQGQEKDAKEGPFDRAHGHEPFGFEPLGLELGAERLRAERLAEWGGEIIRRCLFNYGLMSNYQ